MNRNLIAGSEIYEAETVSRVAVLKIKSNPLYQLTDLDVKKSLFDYLDAINDSKDIQVLLII